MKPALFIVCPFSCLEPFLRSRYGHDAFFLTSTGAVMSHQPWEYLEAVADLITREKIRTVYIVNDTSCRFIDGIIRREPVHGLPAESELQEIYVDHYHESFRGQPLHKQQFKLAELNVNRQAHALMESLLVGSVLAGQGVTVKGLVTSRLLDAVREVRISQHDFELHES